MSGRLKAPCRPCYALKLIRAQARSAALHPPAACRHGDFVPSVQVMQCYVSHRDMPGAQAPFQCGRRSSKSSCAENAPMHGIADQRVRNRREEGCREVVSAAGRSMRIRGLASATSACSIVSTRSAVLRNCRPCSTKIIRHSCAYRQQHGSLSICDPLPDGVCCRGES